MDMACVDDDDGLGFHRNFRKSFSSGGFPKRYSSGRIQRPLKVIKERPRYFVRPVKRPTKANPFVCKMVRRF